MVSPLLYPPLVRNPGGRGRRGDIVGGDSSEKGPIKSYKKKLAPPPGYRNGGHDYTIF